MLPDVSEQARSVLVVYYVLQFTKNDDAEASRINRYGGRVLCHVSHRRGIVWMRQSLDQEILESSGTWFKGVCNRKMVATDEAMLCGLDAFSWIIHPVGNHVFLSISVVKKKSYKSSDSYFLLEYADSAHTGSLLTAIEKTIQQSLVETIKDIATSKEIPVDEKRLFCSLVLFDRKIVSEWQIVFLISKDQKEHDGVLRALDNFGLGSITYIARFMDADYIPKLVREDSYIEIIKHQDLYNAKCCDHNIYTFGDSCKFITLEPRFVSLVERMVKEAGRAYD